MKLLIHSIIYFDIQQNEEDVVYTRAKKIYPHKFFYFISSKLEFFFINKNIKLYKTGQTINIYTCVYIHR
jgi:hypothetical protein